MSEGLTGGAGKMRPLSRKGNSRPRPHPNANSGSLDKPVAIIRMEGESEVLELYGPWFPSPASADRSV